ncbi:Signaling protein with a sensor domain, HAMP, GGDEF and EAL domains [Marinomonas sp. MED121]|uniref:sensor domain-containing protein n=1 Tax=Marinomonas sp. MED121 TaxID=314277 RepID=UPI000068FD1E|nr:EAL domain-containing protein [Marinomonas sp. MED121]EAQ63740.1 Signaling protein with a sensor domain, HAMP, GGDEF and EAL domains [Marinomonas sp. MED121]
MLINFLKDFFLIKEEQLALHDKDTFRKSALRILLMTALFFGLAINLMTSIEAWRQDNFLIIAINLSFVLLTLFLIKASKHYSNKLSATFLISLLISSLLMIPLIQDNQTLKHGLVFLYTLPILSRLFFGVKASLIAMGFNVLTYTYIVSDFNISLLPKQYDLTLPNTDMAFHTVVFVFINIAIPLAISRIFYTLEANAKQMEVLNNKINRNNELYEEIFEHTGTATLLCNRNGQILKANRKATKLLGFNDSNQLEESFINRWLAPIGESKERYFWQSNASNCQLRSDDKIHIELHRSNLTTHGYYVMHLQNVTHLKAMRKVLDHTQERNSRLAKFDALTQLPNHSNFCQLVNQKITKGQEHKTGAMFIIRISQFKLLNKQFGQEKANQIIISFTRKLQENLSDKTITSRLRGVKFACFIPIGQTYLIQRNLSALIQSVLPPQLKLNGESINLEYHVGISYTPSDGTNAQELIEHCEMALENATSADRLAYYNHARETNLIEEYQLGTLLSEAIKQDEIHLWLQPQVSASGDIVSFEALARWQLSNGQYVSPVVFIRIAESLGLLPKLAENLVRELVSLLAVWHQEHIKTPVAINLAGQELMDDTFFALIMSLSADYTWLSEMLELEITETSSVMTNPLIHKRLKTLSQYGFSIAIDDFGTGQASLGQLIDIPANILKIDRRFVAPLPSDKRHLDIVKSTIEMANSLNMKVVAEGIETKDQAELLAALGCHTLQGYYFGKPTPVLEWTKNDNEKAKQLRMVF